MRLYNIILIFLFSISIQAQEICNNCIDDDGDGLVDCYDPDCCGQNSCNISFICQPVGGGLNQQCVVDSFPNVQFQVPVLWQNATSMENRRTIVAGDIDNDGETEAVLVGGVNDGMIIVNGITGQNEHVLNLPHISTFYDSPAFADVDHDGYAEIYLVTSSRLLMRFEYDGANWSWSDTVSSSWISPTIGYSNGYGTAWSPSLADFNYDGIPEVIVGNQIFNSLTGAFICQAPNGQSGNLAINNVGVSTSASFPVAADVLPDGFCTDCQGLEYVAGNEVYSVDIFTNTMTLVSSISDNIISSNDADGMTSVADFNGDGLLDIIVNGQGGWIYVWDPRLQATINGAPYKISANTSAGGHPSVADFDNDNKLEIGVAGKNIFIVLENDLSLKWSIAVNDPSGMTSASVFDFDNDGSSDVVYVDEQNLRVMDGKTGQIKALESCGNATRTNYPTVVDVNGDGEANILCMCANTNGGANGNMKAFSSANIPWVASRRIMNQHSFFNVNIEDDMTICAQQQDHGKIDALNMFLSQSPLYDGNGNVMPLAASDLIVNIDSLGSMCNDSIEVFMTICNQGISTMPGGFPISFYNGDPKISGSKIKDVKFSNNVDTINCETFSQKVFVQSSFDLYVYVNDSGLVLNNVPNIKILECDTTNNWANTPINYQSAYLSFITDDVLCNGEQNGQIEVNANLFDAQEYIINGGSNQITNVFDNLNGGNYFIQAINSCSDTIGDWVSINEPAALEIDLDSIDVSCYGDSSGRVFGNALGGVKMYTWTWSSGQNLNDSTLINLTAGIYSATITDQNNCTAVKTINVNQPQAQLNTILDTIHLNCFGEQNGKAWVTASGGTSPYVYSWSGGTALGADTIVSLSAGSYTLSVTDFNLCSKVHTFDVTSPPALNLNLDTISYEYCGGNNGLIGVAGVGGIAPYDFTWSNGQANSGLFVDTIKQLDSAYYSVTVQDANGCNFINMYMIDSIGLPEFEINYLDSCENAIIDFNVNVLQGNNLQYYWDMGDGFSYMQANPSHTYLGDGAYVVSLTVIDENQCDVTETKVLQIYQQPIADFEIDTNWACDSTIVYCNNIGTYSTSSTFYWDFGNGNSQQENPSYTFNQVGEHSISLEVTNEYGCKDVLELTDTISIYASPDAAFFSPNNNPIYVNDQISFVDLSSTVNQWYWDFGDGEYSTDQNPFKSYNEAATYEVKLVIVDENTCQDSTFQSFDVFPYSSYYIPNAFSPNGDGENDVLYLRGMEIAELDFKVFNRWGEVVFETSDINIGWDGAYNSEPLDADVFVYTLGLKYASGVEDFARGNITLVR